MTNRELKIINNMSDAINEIKLYEKYTDHYFFNLYNAIEGYKTLKEYVSEEIEQIINTEYDGFSLFNLLRNSRNMYGHTDKINGNTEYVILHTKVSKNLLDKLEMLLFNFVDNLMNKCGDLYLILKNNRRFITLFLFLKSISSDTKSNDIDESVICNKIQQLFEDYDYEKSTIDDWSIFFDKYLDIIKSESFKSFFIKKYDKYRYIQLVRMLTDDNFSDEEFVKFSKSFKNTINT